MRPFGFKLEAGAGAGWGSRRTLWPRNQREGLETSLLRPKPQGVWGVECLGLGTAVALLTPVGTTRRLRVTHSSFGGTGS